MGYTQRSLFDGRSASMLLEPVHILDEVLHDDRSHRLASFHNNLAVEIFQNDPAVGKEDDRILRPCDDDGYQQFVPVLQDHRGAVGQQLASGEFDSRCQAVVERLVAMAQMVIQMECPLDCEPFIGSREEPFRLCCHRCPRVQHCRDVLQFRFFVVS